MGPGRHIAAFSFPSRIISPVLSLRLPERTRPASARDVAAGEAVFTLEGRGEVRFAALPGPLPIPAGPAGQSWASGPVIQAEEVREQGVWRRYYGFVDQNGLRMATAESIALTSAPRSATSGG